jgi:hypothetical protein
MAANLGRFRGANSWQTINAGDLLAFLTTPGAIRSVTCSCSVVSAELHSATVADAAPFRVVWVNFEQVFVVPEQCRGTERPRPSPSRCADMGCRARAPLLVKQVADTSADPRSAGGPGSRRRARSGTGRGFAVTKPWRLYWDLLHGAGSCRLGSPPDHCSGSCI